MIDSLFQEKDTKICIYALGKRSIPTMAIMKCAGVRVDYICDKDSELLSKINIDAIEKLTLADLMNYISTLIVIITICGQGAEETKKNLASNENLHLILIDEFIKTDYLINKIVGISLKEASASRKEGIKYLPANNNCKIAVYTCITGNYDEIPELGCVEENIDYFLLTDDTAKELSSINKYNVVDIETVIPKNIIGPKERNRYAKMHGYEIFRDYDYSIYIDGNLEIISPIRPLISLIGECGLAMHRMTMHGITDPYEEALYLYLIGRVGLDSICGTLRNLAEEGLPRHCGVIYGNVIVCDNNSKKARDILNEWFYRYQCGEAKRDQFYLPLVLCKKRISIEQIALLPGMAHTNGYFKLLCGHSGVQMK